MTSCNPRAHERGALDDIERQQHRTQHAHADCSEVAQLLGGEQQGRQQQGHGRTFRRSLVSKSYNGVNAVEGKQGAGREFNMWGSPLTLRQTMYLRRGSVCRRSASSMPADVASMACPLASPVSARVAPMSLPKPTRPEQRGKR